MRQTACLIRNSRQGAKTQRIVPVFIAVLILGLSSGCIRNYAGETNCTLAPSSANQASIPQGLGVNIHFVDPEPGEMKMIADAGFRWVRMDFKWDATERVRGSYDFSSYDRLMSELQSHNIKALFILDYGNPLYDNGAPPRTSSTREAFARWAVAAAKHFAGRGAIWEVYNEPNHDLFWPPRPDATEYVQLALVVGRAFRAEVPEEKLVGPAVSEFDFSFLEECFKAGLLEYWSAVSVHPYLRSDPESVTSEYCRLRQMIGSYKKREAKEIPIISSEWGYSSVWRGLSEEKQGAIVARQALINTANNIPISIWYDWRDDGSDPDDAEHHFGLIRRLHEPKPAYLAAKTLSEVLNGYTFERRLNVGQDRDFVLVFSKGSEVRYAAWTTWIRSHQIAIPIPSGDFSIQKHTGQLAGSASVGPQGLTVDVSSAPIYLTRRPGPR